MIGLNYKNLLSDWSKTMVSSMSEPFKVLVSWNVVNRDSMISSTQAVELETKYSAHNYRNILLVIKTIDPLPVVCASGKGSTITDPEGKTYLDFLSACKEGMINTKTQL